MVQSAIVYTETLPWFVKDMTVFIIISDWEVCSGCLPTQFFSRHTLLTLPLAPPTTSSSLPAQLVNKSIHALVYAIVYAIVTYTESSNGHMVSIPSINY